MSQHVISSNISLVKASEVDDIMQGNDEAFKAISVNSYDTPTPRLVIHVNDFRRTHFSVKLLIIHFFLNGLNKFLLNQ